MFGWRKKTDGFDWHAYVRTTIKVRREARRERIDAARQAALEKAHAAGHAVVDGGKAAGRAAVKGVQDGAVHGARGLGWVWQQIARTFRVAFGPIGEWLMASTARTAKKLAASEFAGPVALIGAVAAASGAFRWWYSGFNLETAIPLGLGALMLMLAAPALLGRAQVGVPQWLAGKPAWVGAAAVGAIAIGAGGYAMTRPGAPAMPSLGSLSKISILPGAAAPVEGRAAVVSADTLRINNALYRLAGIEAPERGQTCSGGSKDRWRCGEAAQSALIALARGKVVVCKPNGSADVTGRTAATCTVDGKDVAADLVRAGHVFASSSMFGGYGTLEADAKSARRGLWKGEAERPAAWRDKVWAEAKKASPEGCPIKAVSTGNAKVYVMPWSPAYKTTTVRAGRGERWFCTESEAAAAGFRAERT